MAGSANARVVVEIAVESAAGALAAANAGADRLELCASLGEGGLSPSPGTFATTRAAVGLPLFVMVRPRAGDFCYSDTEFAAMLADIAHFRAGGADGIVTGVLTAAGRLDAARMRALGAAAAPLPVTCHRAFDLTPDADAALELLCELGVPRVLSSGQAAAAPLGAACLRRLVDRAAGRLAVMAGAGVRAENVASLVQATGVREVHLSATAWRASPMQFRRQGVPMGSSPPPDEFQLRTTDGAVVAAVVAALRTAPH